MPSLRIDTGDNGGNSEGCPRYLVHLPAWLCGEVLSHQSPRWRSVLAHASQHLVVRCADAGIPSFCILNGVQYCKLCCIELLLVRYCHTRACRHLSIPQVCFTTSKKSDRASPSNKKKILVLSMRCGNPLRLTTNRALVVVVGVLFLSDVLSKQASYGHTCETNINALHA